jgi:hypothetical protein
MHQIELGIASPSDQLEMALAIAEREVAAALDQRSVS